jgi:hypothetical protein
MCNIWWPTFGNAERSLFLSLSLSLSLHNVSTLTKGLVDSRVTVWTEIWHRTSFTIDFSVETLCRERERERERERGSFQRCQMYVTKSYTLVVLALLAAHHIFHISRIKVKSCKYAYLLTFYIMYFSDSCWSLKTEICSIFCWYYCQSVLSDGNIYMHTLPTLNFSLKIQTHDAVLPELLTAKFYAVRNLWVHNPSTHHFKMALKSYNTWMSWSQQNIYRVTKKEVHNCSNYRTKFQHVHAMKVDI